MQQANTKPANMYNGRKPTSKKPGTQKGHKGSGLSRAVVEDKICRGIYIHHVEEIGTPDRPYTTRYRLELDVITVAVEIHIYADDEGRFQNPPKLKGEVTCGKSIKAITAFLYSGGIVSNDRICTDSTTVNTNGNQTYIRNFSTENTVLYYSSEKKDTDTLSSFSVLNRYTGILTHNHETALYHFGQGMGNAIYIWAVTCVKTRRRRQTGGAMTWKCC